MNIVRRRLLVALSAGLARPFAEVKAAPADFSYGRFKVYQEGQKLVVLGGRFVPPLQPPRVAVSPHVLFINYTTKELMYYRRQTDGLYESMVGFAVVTPEAATLPRGEVRGLVTKIDRTPTWCPTPSIFAADPSLVHKADKGRCFSPRHPANAMGEVRIEVSWRNAPEAWETHRIHGTAGYHLDFFNRSTFGCVRLYNDAIIELVDLLEKRDASAEVEVVMYR